MNNKKIAVVTGASRGIGNAIAIKFANEGYDIITIGSSPKERAEDGLNKIRAAGANVHYICGSIGDQSAREELLAAVRKAGRVDVLVNNASVAPKVRGDLLDLTQENMEYLININVYGNFFLTQMMVKYMIELLENKIPNCMPSIINISSISAYTASVNRGEYCISKSGISMITKLYATRLAEYGIPVFEIRPGVIETDMISSVKQKYIDQIENGLTPIKRLGLPEDIANASWVLASGQLTYTTGEVLNIDGGFHIRRL